VIRTNSAAARCLVLLTATAGFVSVACGRLHAAAAQTKAAALPPATVRATLDRYCVTCHNDRLRTAGLTLERFDASDVPRRAETWEKVAAKLRAGDMPPPRAPRPDDAVATAVATSLEAALDDAAAAKPYPGRGAIHRLNRTEYTNAIRDLLALEIDGRSLLPSDDQGYGFDNNAGALTVSPGLMDRYLLAARKVGRLAIGDVSMRPVVETFTVPRLLSQDDRVSEDLPFGSRGGISIRHHFPLDAEYVLRVRLQGSRLLGPGEHVEVRLDGERVALFTMGADAGKGPAAEGARSPVLEARFAANAGPRLLGVAIVKRTSAPEGLAPARLPIGNISFRPAGVAAVELEGPLDPRGPGDTPSRRRIFICRPERVQDEERCAGEILAALARRAYRRPVQEKDVRTLLEFYEAARSEGFERGIRAAIERMLVDPEFLFRVEREPAARASGAAYRISDVELASRLSFFLWSSIPDEELLDEAARGGLANPPTLDAQVRRMLKDWRSEALVTNFAAQWLHLRNLRAVAPDGNEFPEFDDNLRQAFQRETELFIESQLREDRGVADLLSANHTFVNERLARHYGIPHIYGSHFRRVTLDRPERRGLLGHGSILTVTSYATRTSPVVRGRWLLENVLGAPPPPPPADVPALAENDEGGQPLSVRERMEAHRKNAVCASCHARMDPLGFALENFDAIGKWRDRGEDQLLIDASAVLPDGTAVDGPVGLSHLLLARRDDFVKTVAEKMFTYAIGRGVAHYDRPALRRVVREAASTGSTWSSLVLAIVRSTPFQVRTPSP
jgi:hypothetical protein